MSKISSIKDILTNQKNGPKSLVKCSQCASDTIKLCQRCLVVPYCTRECQEVDWKVHKQFCLEVKEARKMYEPMMWMDEVMKEEDPSMEEKQSWNDEFCQARYILLLAIKACSIASNFLPGVQLVLDNMFELLKVYDDDETINDIKHSVPSIMLFLEKPELAYSYIKFISKMSDADIDWSKFSIETLPKEDVEEPLTSLDIQQMKFKLVMDLCLTKIMRGVKLESQVVQILKVVFKRKPKMLPTIYDRSGKNGLGEDKDMNEVLKNTYHLWQTNSCQQFLFGSEMKAAWAMGLPTEQAYEWLVDCYRMRLDDEYVWGGGILRGLYDGNDDPYHTVLEFLAFCKLAKAKKFLPIYWDWKAFLSVAAKFLRYAFEKSDAKEKYGSENIFMGGLGGRSLRYTGEQIYGSSITQGTGKDNEKMMKKLRRGIRKETTDDVGGPKIWNSLVREVANQF